MHSLRKMLLVGVLPLMLVLAACGNTAVQPTPLPDSADTQPTPEVDTASETGETETDATPESAGSLVVYSGRSESLIGPLMEQFTEDTGVGVDVRYGDTAELAATILEEGANSPADVFFAQDAGALGAISSAGLFAPLSEDILERVEPRFRSSNGDWVGVSGRARVIVYNTDAIDAGAVPGSVTELTDPQWQGRVGWAPTNGSFQAFVTALRVALGEDAAREWIEGMIANNTQVYENNTAIVRAVASGEVDLGLVNHYYLYRLQAEGEAQNAANFFPTEGDIGALINVAGIGILNSSDQQDLAEQLAYYLLSEPAQQYFVDETFEYPLAAGLEANPDLPPLSEIETPEIDLNDLEDLEGTLQLLQEVGALQ